ncbi:heat-inducible transcriptional repressor HrcA [Clostridium niameyense]|uniref:Heat-inducible transcription repressor HrcA n=1 Tax=Clostridium niameyense TaxID=1622073 RepID=A0A6M0R7V9_9CLOT|nr:heat-inducible transcriptional repressor HrcA [Clostridium niameyense]NEZ45699.1 heat-inducible transcriptional repressor HrcA [Clostridium niameyense]
MDERKIKILHAIINDYINTGEPIGSRTIAKKYDLGVSSATIRNEMADLEDMGYLEQIHSSSGRRPSDRGYRLYVDKLMTLCRLSEYDEKLIKDSLINSELYEVDKLIRQSISLLSELTNLTCLVRTPSMERSNLKSLQIVKVDENHLLLVIITDSGVIRNNILRIKNNLDNDGILKLNNILNSRLRGLNLRQINTELIYELKNTLLGYDVIFNSIILSVYDMLTEIEGEKIYMEGATNIFNYVEYNDVSRAKEFLSMLDDKSKLDMLLNVDSGMSVKIGAENFIEDARNCSVISAVYSIGRKPIGTIGVIGPTRIPYGKVISTVATIVKEINLNLTKDKNIDI